ncbi:MAG: xanthine dehydrogenase accessory protein XdhC [Rubrivivax sp.]|nr:xanthine dehydrogenase accessory protein XdhC [Rubrivivax sp.]
MTDLREAALAWRAAGRPAVVVEVAAHRGSVPREAGTRMLVATDEVVGTIGGGHLELQAIAQARELIGLPGATTRHQDLALGPSLGQCCGGALTLRYTPLALDAPQAWPVRAARFALQLYGAGHVGRAIAALLARLPCRVQWIDERDSEFPAEPSPRHIERVCVEPVQAEVAQAPPGAFYLVLTHSHDLDLAITHEICKRGDFGFFGLIGSKTKKRRFEHRLAERGIAEEVLARITCPIGLPGIEGKEPEVIALAAVAQLMQAAGAAAASFAGPAERPSAEGRPQVFSRS